MRVSLTKIRSVLRDYLDSKGEQTLLISEKVVRTIQGDFQNGYWDYYKYGTGFPYPEDFIVQEYEEYLEDCQHDEVDYTDDNSVICRYCGTTLGGETINAQ